MTNSKVKPEPEELAIKNSVNIIFDDCPVCGTPEASIYHQLTDVYYIECLRCGKFSITSSALGMLRNKSLNKRQKAILSSVIRDAGEGRYITDFIDSSELKKLMSRKDITPLDKLDRLLVQCYQMAIQGIGTVFSKTEISTGDPSTPTSDECTLMAACWAMDTLELNVMFNHLQEQGYLLLGIFRGWLSWRLTTKGLARVAELLRDKGEGERAFVAMWFAPETAPAYEEAIEPAIRAAGYAPIRIDREHHANKIDDQIIMEIRRSRFMVADFTGQRPGVYYEAGFAQGRDIPVIWTCKEGEEERLHFDTRQYNHVLWKDDGLQDFKDRLHQRIEAVVGHGPVEYTSKTSEPKIEKDG